MDRITPGEVTLVTTYGTELDALNAIYQELLMLRRLVDVLVNGRELPRPEGEGLTWKPNST